MTLATSASLNRYTTRMPHPQSAGLSGLRIETLGIVRNKTDGVDMVFAKPAIFFVEVGEGILRIAKGPVLKICGPCLTYVEPGVRYRYGASGAMGWDERFVVFSGERVEDWIGAGWLPFDSGPLPVGNPGFVAAAHDRLMNLSGDSHDGSGDQLLLECERLIFELHLSRVRPKTAVERIRRRLDGWWADPGKVWDLESEARSCGLSYSRFRELFRSHFGQSPHQRLIDLRMEWAARMLVETRDPIKAVASGAGYETLEAFHRVFRRRFQQTPGQFRRFRGL